MSNENISKFESQNESLPEKINDLEAIEESRNKMISTREEIADLVEKPLLKACESLWDKNIKTLSTSANSKDLDAGFGYIIIDFDHLSLENQQIAKSMAEPIEYDEGSAVIIEIPLLETETVQETELKAINIANQFQNQEATWIPSYTLEDLRQAYGYPPETDLAPEEFLGASDDDTTYYDPKDKLFYKSKEHYLKLHSK